MDFLTAYYRQSDAGSVSLLLQQYRLRGRHVCFACLAENGDAGAYMTKQLLFWFRELSGKELTNMVNRENGAERLSNCLRKRLERTDEEIRNSGWPETEQVVAVTGILCVDDAYLYFGRGGKGQEALELRGYLLNSYLGTTCINQLSQSSSVQDAKGGLSVEYGRMEENIGILLATDSFYHMVGTQQLREGLDLASMRTAQLQEKRLAELAMEAERAGGCDMAAVLLTTHKSDARAISRKEKPRQLNKEKPQALCGTKKSGTAIARLPIQLIQSFGQYGYEVEGLLGQGAFAGVYLIKEPGNGGRYACKVSGNKALLKREHDVMQNLRHPLFPEVYGYWEWGEYAFLKMEYIVGENLQKQLLGQKYFHPRQIVKIGLELAEGLRYLHEAGFLFRDVKPENIMMTPRGAVKLIDLGCVCELAERSKAKAGTPGYGAPEQFTEEETGVAADVYGLGRTLEALAREKYCCRELQQMIWKCTRRDAEERLPDMYAVIRVLGKMDGNNGRYLAKNRGVHRKEWLLRSYQKNIWQTAQKRA